MITAAGRDNLIDICAVLVLLVLDHNILRYLLGYGIATLFSMDETSSHTITFEVGLQNSGLAEMGRVAIMGLACAVFSPLVSIRGSSLACMVAILTT